MLVKLLPQFLLEPSKADFIENASKSYDTYADILPTFYNNK